MGIGSKILLIFFIITSFFISFLCTHIVITSISFNLAESFTVNEANEVYSVEEEQQDVMVLEKFRSLLGLNNFLARTSATIGSDTFLSPLPSPSPSPLLSPSRIIAAEAPAPSPLVHSHRKHAHFPLHNHHHIFPPIPRRKQKVGDNARRLITAILVSFGIGSMLCAFGVFWVCKKFRKQRKKTISTVSIYSNEAGIGGRSKHEVASEDAVKMVRSDPRPDLFYLDSLAAALDTQPFCLKENPITINANYDDNSLNGREESEKEATRIQPDQDSGECCGVGEIMSAHEETEKADSSDNESFHSVCNSHSSSMRLSIASASSLSEYSEAASPKGSEVSLVSSPPTYSTTKIPALEQHYSRSCNLEGPVHSTRLPPPPPPPPPPPTFFQDPCIRHAQSNSSDLRSSTLANASSSGSVGSASVSNHSPQIGGTPSPPNPPKPPQGIPPPPLPPSYLRSTHSSLNCPSPLIQPFQSTSLIEEGSRLPKLKPLHWDKVRAAPDRSTVWDKLKSSSFEFDEEMIETLFGYNLQNSMKNDEVKTKTPSPTKHVLEPKRLQNITILSKALNVTAEQVCDALMRGSGLSLQELEALVKMVPTKEEEAKLLYYEGSIDELGSAEKFVKAMLNIPYGFSRVEAMLYKETFDDELIHLRKSFFMLEEACKELRSSRLFLKLLEAVLKTGNRMNVGTIRGGAKAFKLDALLKLADVKGTDGKTTLLHFVVQEIIRSEGFRASESIMGKINQKSKGSNNQQKEQEYRRLGLDLVCGLSTELSNVKKTASLDLDVLVHSVSNLSEGMNKLKHLVYENLSSKGQDGNFVCSMKTFLKYSEKSLNELQEDENRILLQVREITEYFHGDVGKDERNPIRIFVIVRDFLGLLDHVCKELRSSKSPCSPNPLASFR